MSQAEGSFTAAWWVVDELVRSGVEHASVSPGSRSTPIALALWRHPQVRVHVHLDERASAFFALGVAKATGRPAAVACTSGTAVAELLPAVVEASMSRATLVLLTADRPPELRGVGANQTIEQPGIFGVYVRAGVDAPVPDEAPDEDPWREIVRGLVRAALGPPPGPVHLNLPFREPLTPGEISLPASPLSSTDHAIVSAPPDREVDDLGAAISSTPRGLILAGSMRESPAPLVELSHRSGWPLLAEPTSGHRVPGALEAGQSLVADDAFADAHVPETIVQFGAAPTSRAGLELVRRADRLLVVDPDHLVADPHRRAAASYRAAAAALATELIAALEPRPASTWSRSWLEADQVARAVVDAELGRDEEPFEGRVARDLAAALPDGATLVVGSSSPVRDLDAYMAPRHGLTVLGNRGASGIDGFVSTALGVASAGRGATAALSGDLTFLHDAGSLLWSATRGHDAVFVVLNNAGGALFSSLSQRVLPELEQLFVTPHGLDLAAVSRAAGAEHTVIRSASELVPAITDAAGRGGVRVIEVALDPDRNLRRRAEVRAAVARALTP